MVFHGWCLSSVSPKAITVILACHSIIFTLWPVVQSVLPCGLLFDHCHLVHSCTQHSAWSCPREDTPSPSLAGCPTKEWGGEVLNPLGKVTAECCMHERTRQQSYFSANISMLSQACLDPRTGSKSCTLSVSQLCSYVQVLPCRLGQVGHQLMLTAT